MQLFALQSKAEQLAEVLKKRIVSGKVPTGTKLSSVRDLAGNFKVSTKIVVNALDLLEAEQLIKREPGRGVFVRSRSANPNIEVCLLAWNIDINSNAYFSNLARISYPPYLRNGFNFTVRTVPFSQDATASHFAHELQKFDKLCHADCMVINAPHLSAGKIKACLKLKTPVLFIGDFSHGPDPDIPFNQITGDNEALGRNCVEKLLKQETISELILYIPSLEKYFCRRFIVGATAAASAANLKVHLVEMPKGFSRFNIQRQNKIFLQRTREAGILNLRNIPAINGGIPNNFLKEQSKLSTACQAVYCPVNSENYFLKFYDVIFSEIKRITKTPSKMKIIILKDDLDDFTIKQL